MTNFDRNNYMPSMYGMSLHDIRKKSDNIQANTYKCKCGHTVVIVNKDGRCECTHCHELVFKDKKTEFKFRLNQNLIKEKRNMK